MHSVVGCNLDVAYREIDFSRPSVSSHQQGDERASLGRLGRSRGTTWQDSKLEIAMHKQRRFATRACLRLIAKSLNGAFSTPVARKSACVRRAESKEACSPCWICLC